MFITPKNGLVRQCTAEDVFQMGVKILAQVEIKI